MGNSNEAGPFARHCWKYDFSLVLMIMISPGVHHDSCWGVVLHRKISNNGKREVVSMLPCLLDYSTSLAFIMLQLPLAGV